MTTEQSPRPDPSDGDQPALTELPAWIANFRRSFGVVVLVLFFFGPWFTSASGRGWDTGDAYTGSSLFAFRADSQAKSGWTSPIRIFEGGDENGTRRQAFLSMETPYWLFLIGSVPVGALALLVGPRRRARRSMVAITLVSTGGAASILLRSIVTPGGVFTWGCYFNHTIVGETIEWFLASAPLLAAGFAIHAIVFRRPWVRWPLRALLGLAVLGAVVAPLLDATRGFESHWSVGQTAHWALSLTACLLGLTTFIDTHRLLLSEKWLPLATAIASVYMPPTTADAHGITDRRWTRLLYPLSLLLLVGTFAIPARLLWRAYRPASLNDSGTLPGMVDVHRPLVHEGEVHTVEFSPQGDLLASGSQDGTIRLWSIPDGALVRTLEGKRGPINSVAFSPDGSMVAGSLNSDLAAGLWRVSDGRLVRTFAFKDQATGPIHSIAFSRDGSLLASAHWDDRIGVWSASDGSLVRTVRGHGGTISTVAFSPDGALLASGGSDKAVRLWSMRDGTLVRSLDGHGSEPNHVMFSPKGDLIASTTGYDEAILRLWSVADGKLIREHKGNRAWLCAAFSPDGKLIASGSWEGNIRLFSVEDGSLVRTIEGGSVMAIGYSPRGDMLATSCWVEPFEGSVKLVPLR